MKKIITILLLSIISSTLMAENQKTESYPLSIDEASALIEKGNNFEIIMPKESDHYKVYTQFSQVLSKDEKNNGNLIIKPLKESWTEVSIKNESSPNLDAITYRYYPKGLFSVKYSYTLCEPISRVSFIYREHCNGNREIFFNSIVDRLEKNGYKKTILLGSISSYVYKKNNTVVQIDFSNTFDVIVTNSVTNDKIDEIEEEFKKALEKNASNETKYLFK